MKKIILLLTLLPYWACNSDKVQPKPIVVNGGGGSTKPDSIKRTVDVIKGGGVNGEIVNHTTNQTTRELFLKLPNTIWHIAGIENLSKKYKEELLDKGRSAPYALEIQNHIIRLMEIAQNEDDDTEKRAQIDIALFNKPNNNYVAFVSEKMIKKQGSTPDIVSQKYWEYDGKNWTDISKQMPIITTQTFYNKPIEGIKKDFILLKPNSNNADELTATLLYDSYTSPLSPEHFRIRLLWDGNTFQMQQEDL